jgi:HAD superfamily hydrolase (TIGR01459 family)
MTSLKELPPEISGFSSFASNYDGVLCDIWGVIHNGINFFPEAIDALQKYRDQGGVVVLITNSPRTALGVEEQLAQMKIPENAWDGIVTSGDITRNQLRRREGKSTYHLGPARDEGVFSGISIDLVDEKDADFITCTGLFEDDTESPDDYRSRLEFLNSRNLTMICSNPDLIVQRGERLIYCAGALAVLYEELGGDVVYTGKPWQPIYERGFELMNDAAKRSVTRQRILAIGDAVMTDLLGAKQADIASLFVLGGIHSDELARGEGHKLAERLAQVNVRPAARQNRLVW